MEQIYFQYSRLQWNVLLSDKGWEIGTISAIKISSKRNNCFIIFILNNINFFNTRYAKIHIPIIASVSEHQPTTWVSFFFDLHILVCTFPAGLWFCIKNINDERVFGKRFFNKTVIWNNLFSLLRLSLQSFVFLCLTLCIFKMFPLILHKCLIKKNSAILYCIYSNYIYIYIYSF